MSRITKDQSKQLDSIRGLSALIVLAGHTHQAFIRPTFSETSIYVSFLTQFAVMVFFVLSGFLIGKSICNNISTNGDFSLAKYAKDRALRLYPPLIAAIVLMLILAMLAPYFFTSGTANYLSIPGFSFIRETFTANAKHIYGTLVFFNGFKTTTPAINGPLWSLSIEAWYYVIAAAIFLWPTKKIAATFLTLITIAITYKNPLFFILMPIWLAGLGLAFIHRERPKMNNSVFFCLFIILTIGTIFSIWLVLTTEANDSSPLGDRMNHFRLISGLWFASFLALLLGNALRFPTIFQRTAAFSYTLYITHFPIILFVVGMTQKIFIQSFSNALALSLTTMVIAIVASIFLSKTVENKKLVEDFISTHLKKAKYLNNKVP